MPTLRMILPCAASAICSFALAAGPDQAPPPVSEAAPKAARNDAELTARIDKMTAAAIGYLSAAQDKQTGSWGVRPGAPVFPAVTGLVVSGLRLQPGLSESDPALAKGEAFILSMVKPTGGIYDALLPSYNTAICLSALSKSSSPKARAALKPAQDFLRSLQYSEGATVYDMKETPQVVGREHAFYGGIGYGSHGRPDMSNLSFALQGLHDSGVEGSDVAFQRALVFLQRCQMVDSINDMPYADGSRQGGFIYATSENKDKVGLGQSQAASPVEETLDDGTKVSRLRAYGSMTYAGFKSYIYANLPRDDARVQAALGWIKGHYTLHENPGMGNDGLYYYYLTFARALSAWGERTLEIRVSENVVQMHDWKEDLVDRLAQLQQADGSFQSVSKRWMEEDPVLITAYALQALQHARP